MKPIIAAIPTIGKSPKLRPLVEDLLTDNAVEEIMLVSNYPNITLDVPTSQRIFHLEVLGNSLSAMWNTAIRYAAVEKAYLAVLNDDIEFCEPYSLSQAAHLFDRHPSVACIGFNYEYEFPPKSDLRYCTGTYRNHGVGGFAFMLDAERCPLVDERFTWWGTDDDLFIQIDRQNDQLAIANHLGVRHYAETTASQLSWTLEARAKDRDTFIEKYGPKAAW